MQRARKKYSRVIQPKRRFEELELKYLDEHSIHFVAGKNRIQVFTTRTGLSRAGAKDI